MREVKPKTIEKDGDLEFRYNTSHNIFGLRHSIEIVKTCKNIPGFAPTTFQRTCGDLVMNFKEHEPYWQMFEDCPSLEIGDVKKILAKLEKGFESEKHYTREEYQQELKLNE